jgi:heme exporter protein A
MPEPDATTSDSEPGGGPPPVVVAQEITRLYGPRRALAGVDLTIRTGDFLTLFGPNGAGKTTLLKAIAMLIRPTSGTLSLFGLDSGRWTDRVKRRIGLIGHAGFAYDGLTGRDNLKFYGRLYDVDHRVDRADELLRQVGLQDRADDAVRTYSRGMRQRLAIARALIHDPALVLLDEPYTGLDQHASSMLRSLLDQVRGRGRSVVMVTHQLAEGLRLSNRIAIMARGRIVLERPTDGLSREELERIYHDAVGRAIP